MVKPKQKVPSYFRTSPPLQWDICDYLEAEFNRRSAIHFNFGIAINNWTATILHFSNRGEGDQKTVSIQKLEHYRGCPGDLSDKTRARNWRNNKTKKKRNISASPQHSGVPSQPSATPHQVNYYAPVNQVVNGSFDNSPVNFNGNESEGAVGASASNMGEIVDEHPQDAAVVPELKPDKLDVEEKRLILLCKSFQKLRKTMTTTFPLPSGSNLEDCLARYIEGLSHIDPAHGFIVDKKMLSTLSTGDKEHVLSQLQLRV